MAEYEDLLLSVVGTGIVSDKKVCLFFFGGGGEAFRKGKGNMVSD